MTFVDGFIVAVPNDNKDAFRVQAEAFAARLKAHGALQVVDCWGVDVPDGAVTSLPLAVKCEPDETVCLSWVAWPSKQARDAAWEALREDPLLTASAEVMPFDGKRMIFGGFEVVSQA